MKKSLDLPCTKCGMNRPFCMKCKVFYVVTKVLDYGNGTEKPDQVSVHMECPKCKRFGTLEIEFCL
jgi:hypothetical protein